MEHRKSNIVPTEGLEWIPASNGHVPDDAVVFETGLAVGVERMYVTRVTLDREISTGGIAKGKATEVPYYGSSVASSNYDVLVNKGGGVKLLWVHCKDGQFPGHAVQGGLTQDGHKVFVARAKPTGGSQYAVGKYVVGFNGAFVALNGREVLLSSYDILCAKADDGGYEQQNADEAEYGFEPPKKEEKVEKDIQDTVAGSTAGGGADSSINSGTGTGNNGDHIITINSSEGTPLISNGADMSSGVQFLITTVMSFFSRNCCWILVIVSIILLLILLRWWLY